MYGEREPLYGGDKTSLIRVISAPNGLWQAQRRVSHTKGHDATYEGKVKKSEHFDPWENIGCACSKQQASAIVFGPKG